MTDLTTFKTKAYQLYEKLPRPTLRWVCIAITLWVCGGCDIAGYPLEGTVRGIILSFVLAIYGVRAFEKLKGVVE